MSWAILGLLAGFILVLILLYLLLLKTQLAVGYKLIALLAVTGFYWVQYHSLQRYTGWPSTDSLPVEFVLVATDVREPDKQKGVEGVMYWWVRESGDPNQPPRAYCLPYQQQLHEQTEQVIKDQKQGSQYVGRRNRAPESVKGLGIGFEKISKLNRHQKK